MHGRFSWLPRLATSFALVAALLVVVARCIVQVIDLGHVAEYGEGPILAMVQRMQEEPVSAAWLDGPELTLSCYGPVYYWGIRAASALSPWERSLIPGRCLSTLASLTAAGLIGLVVRRHAKSAELGILGALIFLCSTPVFDWATRHRVDALGTLFALGAYLAVTRRRWGLAGSAICVVVGSLVKQSVALSAFPIFLYLLLQKRPKAAVSYALSVATLGTAAWSVLDWASGGYYLAAAVKGNLNSMILTQGYWNGHAFVATPLGIAAVITLAYLLLREPATAIRSVYCVGFVTSTIIATVISSKEGSSASYFMEPCALASLVIGVHALPLLASMHQRRALAMVVLLALVVVSPDIKHIRQYGREQGFDWRHVPYGSSMLGKRLDESPHAYVLADGHHVPMVLHAGYLPLVNDPFLFRLLVDNGGLDPGRVVRAMRRGEVKGLVLKKTIRRHRREVGGISQKWPPEILDAMQRHYELDARGENLFIYKPRRTSSMTVAAPRDGPLARWK